MNFGVLCFGRAERTVGYRMIGSVVQNGSATFIHKLFVNRVDPRGVPLFGGKEL